MADQNNQQQFSFLNMKRCIKKDGGTYIGVTLPAYVKIIPELRTARTGDKFINFRVPTKGRSKLIETMCGRAPNVEDDGITCWANISMWGNIATRFVHYMEKRKGETAKVIITGTIKVEESEDETGKRYTNLNVRADDFFAFYDDKKDDQAASNESDAGKTGTNPMSNAGTSPAASSQHASSIPNGTSAYMELDELDDEDGDLPF